MRRALGITVGAVLLLVVLGLAAGGWYYTNELLPAAVPEPATNDVEVVAADGETLTLDPGDDTPDHDVADLDSSRVVGFQHLTGYVQLSGPPVEARGDATTRQFDVVTGTPPAAGDRGDLQTAAFPADPTALRLAVEDVVATGPVGDMPGWRFPGDGTAAEDWVVLVHGRGATRASTLRAVEVVVGQAGRSALVISYRNDPDAPASPDGFGHFGDTEWQDLQAWLAWLDDSASPRSVTLYGYSQGASIVAACLRWCQGTPRVTGAILDSPLLSMHATLELQAEGRDIPDPVVPPLLWATKVVSTVRGGPDFAHLEHVDALADLDLPLLVFHSRDDDTVPYAPSAALAEADPDQVTLVPFEGGHVRAWNTDPAGYAEVVQDFLTATS